MTDRNERIELFMAALFFITVIVLLWPGGVQ